MECGICLRKVTLDDAKTVHVNALKLQRRTYVCLCLYVRVVIRESSHEFTGDLTPGGGFNEYEQNFWFRNVVHDNGVCRGV